MRAAAMCFTAAFTLSGCATASFVPDEQARRPKWVVNDTSNAVADALADVVTPAQQDTLADATPEQRTCIHRNDDVLAQHVDSELSHAWHNRGAQRAHLRILAALDKRFHTRDYDAFRITNGLLGYGLDMASSRLVMLVDPELIDLPAFRRWVNRVAARATDAEHVRGEPVTVTVQKGCFAAAKSMEVLEHHRESGAAGGHWGVKLDGRVHFYVYPRQRAAAQTFRERYGPAVAIDPCGCPEPL